MLQVIHMNGRHPIDDLFARGLRDAEATPPASVWEGIAHRRGRGYVTWLRLRQRWRMGVLALLLLGGAAAYWTSDPSEPSRTATVPPGPGQGTLAEAPAAHPQTPASEHLAEQVPSSSDQTASEAFPSATTPASMGATAELETVPSDASTPTARSSASSAPVPASPTASRNGAPRTRSSGRNDRSLMTAAPTTSPAPQASLRAAATPPVTSSSKPASVPAALGPTAGTPSVTDAGAARRSEATDLFASRLFPAPAKLDRPAGEAVPDSRIGQPYVLPKADWWIGVQAGYYQETRAWHGTDRQLADGLNSTETTHRPWGVALMGGRAFRSGWGISTGAEYISAQYAFQHEDRIITRDQNINSILVTLDTQVVDLFVDTVVTITEQQRTVEAINRYAIVRVPLEASFHQGCGRWSYGLRAGAAVELLRMRSGFTLSDAGSENGATYSVPVSQGSSRTRSATLLSLSAGVELGYALTDRIGLWLAPTYVRGWMPLGEHDLYALPERTGIRLRVSYTLPSPR